MGALGQAGTGRTRGIPAGAAGRDGPALFQHLPRGELLWVCAARGIKSSGSLLSNSVDAAQASAEAAPVWCQQRAVGDRREPALAQEHRELPKFVCEGHRFSCALSFSVVRPSFIRPLRSSKEDFLVSLTATDSI